MNRPIARTRNVRLYLGRIERRVRDCELVARLEPSTTDCTRRCRHMPGSTWQLGPTVSAARSSTVFCPAGSPRTTDRFAAAAGPLTSITAFPSSPSYRGGLKERSLTFLFRTVVRPLRFADAAVLRRLGIEALDRTPAVIVLAGTRYKDRTFLTSTVFPIGSTPRPRAGGNLTVLLCGSRESAPATLGVVLTA
jgi:hypothetical protein